MGIVMHEMAEVKQRKGQRLTQTWRQEVISEGVESTANVTEISSTSIRLEAYKETEQYETNSQHRHKHMMCR